jgi:hypothetical protein
LAIATDLNMDFQQIFYLDETSPSFLRWKVKVTNRVQKDSVAGSLSHHGYWWVTYKGKHYPVHAIVYYLYFGEYDSLKTIDHIDNCSSNNKPSNLKLATKSEQNKNRRAWGFNTMNNQLNEFEILKAKDSQ